MCEGGQPLPTVLQNCIAEQNYSPPPTRRVSRGGGHAGGMPQKELVLHVQEIRLPAIPAQRASQLSSHDFLPNRWDFYPAPTRLDSPSTTYVHTCVVQSIYDRDVLGRIPHWNWPWLSRSEMCLLISLSTKPPPPPRRRFLIKVTGTGNGGNWE